MERDDFLQAVEKKSQILQSFLVVGGVGILCGYVRRNMFSLEDGLKERSALTHKVAHAGPATARQYRAYRGEGMACFNHESGSEVFLRLTKRVVHFRPVRSYIRSLYAVMKVECRKRFCRAPNTQ